MGVAVSNEIDMKDTGRQKRAMAVRNAIASSRLEGARLSPHVLAKLDKYVDGQVTLESLISEAKHRHTHSRI